MKENYTIWPLGDAALVVQFANRIDDAVHARVMQLFQQLQDARPAYIRDVVPAYASLTVYYDVMGLHANGRSAYEQAKAFAHSLLLDETETQALQERAIRIPVCYAGRFAPDLPELARQKNLSAEEIIQLHTSTTYRVYMIGFLPGFPYMGKVDPRIAAPRKSRPRKSIAAGSVGIAGEQTGIYPLSSPGGWNIIGRTPLSVFNKEDNNPVLLQPGDSVTFYSITEDAFENYPGRIA